MAATVSATPVKIYVKANAAPKLYVWDSQGAKLNGEWPGGEMTETVTIGTESWWVSSTAYEDVNIILNNGSDQTGDIVVTKDNNMFVYNGFTNYYPVNYRDDGVFAYAVDNNNWSQMYAYAWKGEQKNAEWPGQQMTLVGFKDGHGVYLWTANDLPFVPENVIFTNNSGQQTNDIPFLNGSFYETSAIVNDKCDATADATYPLLAIDEAHFPDANFRALLGEDFYTHSQVSAYRQKGYHPDKRNTVVPQWSDQEQQNLAGSIKNLDGIQYLKNLERFVIRGGELEGTIDISKNKSLVEFECTDNFVENLILGDLPTLDRLSCHYNRISNINLSGVPNLTNLNLFVNELTSLDISSLYKLKYLQVSRNNISSITFGNEPYTEMRDIMVSFNNLTSFDASRFPNLEALAINNNPGISEFTFPASNNINMLLCNDCNISSLPLDNASGLYYLLAHNNPLTSIDLSAVPNLAAIDIYGTNISSLDLSSTPGLGYFKMRNPHVVSTTKDFNENSVFMGTPGWQDDDIEIGVISPNGRAIASPQAMLNDGNIIYYYDLTGDNSLTNVVGDGFDVSKVTSFVDATVVQAGQKLPDNVPSYVQNIDPNSLSGDILVVDPEKKRFACMMSTGFVSNMGGASPAPRLKSPRLKESSDEEDIEITDAATLNEMFGTAEINFEWAIPAPPAEPVAIAFTPASGSTLRYGREVTIAAPELGTWGVDYEIFYTLDGTDPANEVNYDNGGSTYKYKGGISINNDDGTVATAIRAKAYQSTGNGVSVVGEATYNVMRQQPMEFERITSVADLEPGKHYLFVGDDEELDENDKPTGDVTTYAAGFEKFETRYQYHALNSCTDFTKANDIISLTPNYFVEPFTMSDDGNGKYLFTSDEGLQVTVIDDQVSEMYGLTLSSTGTPAAITFDNDGYAVVNFNNYAGLMAMNYGKRVDFLVYTGHKDDDTRKLQLWKEKPRQLQDITFDVADGSTVRYGHKVLLSNPDVDLDNCYMYYTIDGSDPVPDNGVTRTCSRTDQLEVTHDATYKVVYYDLSTHLPACNVTSITLHLASQPGLRAELVTSVDDLVAGQQYLIVNKEVDKDGSFYTAMGAYNNTGYKNGPALGIEDYGLKEKAWADLNLEDNKGNEIHLVPDADGVITLDPNYFPEPYILEGGEGAWTFRNVTFGTYVHNTGIASERANLTIFDLAAEPSTAAIAIAADGAATISFDNGNLVLIDHDKDRFNGATPAGVPDDQWIQLYRVIPDEPAAIVFSPASGSTLRYGRTVTIEAPELGTWGTDYEVYYTLNGTDPASEENYYNGGSTYRLTKDGIIIGDDEGTNGTSIRARAYQTGGNGMSVVGEATYTALAQQPLTFTQITSEDDLEAGAHYLIVASVVDGGQKFNICAASFEEYDSREMTTCLRSAFDEAEAENGVISLTPFYLAEPFVLNGNATDGWTFTSTEGLQITPQARSAEALANNEYVDPAGEMDLTLAQQGGTARITFDQDGYADIAFDGYEGRIAFMNHDDDGFFYRPAASDDYQDGVVHIELWKASLPELTFSVPSGSVVRYARPMKAICDALGTYGTDFYVYYTIDGSDPVPQETENCFEFHENAWERDPFINERTSGKTIRARAFHYDRNTWQYDGQMSQIAEVTYTLLPQEELTVEKITSVDQLKDGGQYVIMMHGIVEDHGETEEYYIPAAFEDVQEREATTLLHSDWELPQPENGALTLTPYYRTEIYTLGGNATEGWKFTSTEGLQIIPQIPVGEPRPAPHGNREPDASIGRPEGELDLTLAAEGGTADITFDENGYATIVFEGFTGRVAFQNDDDDGFVYRPASSDDFREGMRYIELWMVQQPVTTVETTPTVAGGTAVHYGQPVEIAYEGRAAGDRFYYTTDGTEPTVGGATTRNGWSNNWFLITVEGTYKFLFTDEQGTPKATGEAAYTLLDDQRHLYGRLVTSEDQLVAGEQYFIVSGEYFNGEINGTTYENIFVPNEGMTPFTEPRTGYCSVGRKGLFEYKESDSSYFDFHGDDSKGDNDASLEVMSIEHLDMIDVHERFENYINHYFIEPYTLGGQAGAWTMTNTLGTSLGTDGLQFNPGDGDNNHKYHLTLGATPAPMTIAIGADGEATLQIDGKTLVNDDFVAYSLTSRNVADYRESYPPLRLYRVYRGVPVTLAEFIETEPDGETQYVIDEDLTVMLVREDVEWHETTDNGGYEGEGWGLLVLRDDAQSLAPFYSQPGANQKEYTIEGAKASGGNQADYRQNNWLHYSLHDYTGENNTHKHIDMSNYRTGDVIKAGTLTGIHWSEGPLMATLTTGDGYTWPQKKMNGEVPVKGDTTLNVYCPANFLLENLNWNNVAGACKYFFMTPKQFEVATMTWAVYDEMELGGETAGAFFVPQKADANQDDETPAHNGADLNGGVSLAWMNSMCQGTYTDESNNEVGIAKDTRPGVIFKPGKAYEMKVWIAHSGESAPDTELGGQATPAPRRAPSRVEPKSNKLSGNFMVFPVEVHAIESVITGVDQITRDSSMKQVKAVRFYNVAGVETREVQPGINIVVTEYTDGTTSTAKILK